MSDSLAQYREKLDAKPVRERVLLGLMAAAVLALLLQTLLIDPLLKEQKNSRALQSNLRSELELQEMELQLLQVADQVGFQHEQLKRRDTLRNSVVDREAALRESVGALVTPEMMTTVVEDILRSQKGMTLMAIENKPVVPLITEADGGTELSSEERRRLYRHSIELRLTGSYAATLEFFERLESLPWQFQWETLHYRVTSYPEAEITLVLDTVSFSEEWIGV